MYIHNPIRIWLLLTLEDKVSIYPLFNQLMVLIDLYLNLNFKLKIKKFQKLKFPSPPCALCFRKSLCPAASLIKYCYIIIESFRLELYESVGLVLTLNPSLEKKKTLPRPYPCFPPSC